LAKATNENDGIVASAFNKKKSEMHEHSRMRIEKN
jgi:hypothetical protein